MRRLWEWTDVSGQYTCTTVTVKITHLRNCNTLILISVSIHRCRIIGHVGKIAISDNEI